MKKVLMIVYAYPPSSMTGMFRSLRFSRYLMDEGWKPVVLTVREKKYDSVDYNLRDEIPPSVKVYRTPAFLFYKRYLKMVKSIRDTLSGWFNLKADKNKTIDCIENRENSNHNRQNNRIVWKRLLGDILRTPDEAVGWTPFAFLTGLFLIYTQKIDAIYASSGPFTSLITGMWLKKVTGKPLIVDFRDPWADGCASKERSHPLFVKISWNLEKKVIFSADTVIANTPTMKKQFVSNYHVDERKIVAISNSFDQRDFQGLVKYNFDKFTISHIGSLTSYRNPVNFFLALKEILDEDRTLRDKINVFFIGDGTYQYQETIDAMGLGKIVELRDRVTHKEALAVMSSSHLLLLLGLSSQVGSNGNFANYQIPCKVFEYFAAKRPILALNGNGDLKNLFRMENVSGEVIKPEVVGDIKAAIKKFYAQYQVGKLEEQPRELLGKYNSQHSTRRLALLLNQTINKE